jgi:hypothetical protein
MREILAKGTALIAMFNTMFSMFYVYMKLASFTNENTQFYCDCGMIGLTIAAGLFVFHYYHKRLS